MSTRQFILVCIAAVTIAVGLIYLLCNNRGVLAAFPVNVAVHEMPADQQFCNDLNEVVKLLGLVGDYRPAAKVAEIDKQHPQVKVVEDAFAKADKKVKIDFFTQTLRAYGNLMRRQEGLPPL